MDLIYTIVYPRRNEKMKMDKNSKEIAKILLDWELKLSRAKDERK